MELPFAVESSVLPRSDDGSSSLVTASSQGSLTASYDPLPPPSTATTTGLDSVLTQFGVSAPPAAPPNLETIDFTYVNICDADDDEVDILLDANGSDTLDEEHPHDILTVLLTGGVQANAALSLVDQANQAAAEALAAKQASNLPAALTLHTKAAQSFRQAAKEEASSAMARSLLLLSQTQAKSALALQRILRLKPNVMAHGDRLRATVRGALDHRTEADLSDSAFLGRAVGGGKPKETPVAKTTNIHTATTTTTTTTSNPVDEMMELERELRNMDMALEMGHSIASLDARTQQRLKNDGSFMMVGSQSALWRGTERVRARANRVQSITPATAATRPAPLSTAAPPAKSLDASWWGNASAASQVLTSSVISLASHAGDGSGQQQQPANTKQLMRLMDSLKTLGDENAALLREVEQAEAARAEAKAAKEQMRRFKEDYGKRFAVLKEALEKFRKSHPDTNGNPVASSEFARSATASDQQARQEALIKKLTADLKKEKEDSRKKDAALRKYESFYREVKARSAQKAAQRQRETQAQPQRPAAARPTPWVSR